MLTIEEYISNIYDEFLLFVNTNPRLCELKKVNFDLSEWPDYSDIHVQQYYLLRYAFIYAFEYKQMYIEAIKRSQQNTDYINILSIGCGSGIDFWSAIEAAKERSLDMDRVMYYGIDKVNWNYKIQPEEMNNSKYINRDVVNLFRRVKIFPHNIFMFPKSIAEFTNEDFTDMCNSLSDKKFEKDQIHVMISLRANDNAMEADIERTEQIVVALGNQGFKTTDNPRKYKHFREKGKGIRSYDSAFIYPNSALDLLNSLNEKCELYIYNHQNCHDNCIKRLTRKPAFTPGIIRFQILSFVRE